MPIVEAKDLSKWYGEVVGLNNLSASIHEGITGIVGPNGAGKTTLIRLLVGLTRPDKGTLKVLGEEPFDNPKLLEKIGYCPDHENMYPNMHALTFLKYMARLNGFERKMSAERARACLDTVGLLDVNRPIGTFSKGMKQRVKIAQALLNEPQVLILDEPFTGVDPLVRSNLFKLIKDLSGKGLNVIISSHILYDIERLAKNVLLINHGKKIISGSIDEIVDIVEDYTHSIIIKTTQSRELGSVLLNKGLVDNVELREEDELFVITKDPNPFYDSILNLAVNEGFSIEALIPVDNDLESVFERVMSK